MSLDVVCFGALNVDRLYRVGRIAGADEESFVTGLQEFPGGSAANTAVGLARLGVKTGYIGKVSDDLDGRLLLEDLRREGVDTAGVVVSRGGRSGVAMGFVDEGGNRALYVDPGVNDTLDFHEIRPGYASSARFLHLTSFVGPRPLEAQRRLVEGLPEGVRVSLDPGEIYARRGLAPLRPLIERSYAVFPSEGEVRLLTGKGYVEGSRVLVELGVRVVAVKLGGRGCYVTDGGEGRLVEPFRVEVVDTTGAGDAFCAGFLYGLLKGRDLYACGRIANYVASRCITRPGAREGLPRESELPRL